MPAERNQHVPRDPKENVLWRKKLYPKMQMDRRFRKGIVEACRQDFLFYVNAFVWQFNPRKSGKEVGPFVTWPFQEDASRAIISAINEQHDLVIEKSREMGASWLCLLAFEWMWHFHPWKKFLAISRNADAVEDDDPDSLFWKIDFIHRYQPTCLLPKFKRRKFYYGNENGSTITGQASTGRAGVGGRATAMLVDEFSQIKEDSEVLDRTSDTTGCRIFNGTHVGVGTAFYRITVGGMRKLQMHWTEHPDKRKGLYRVVDGKVEIIDKKYVFPPEYKFVLDGTPRGGLHPGVRSPWYDEQCGGRKSSMRAIAMDLDVDPQGSVSQFFNPLTIRKLQARDGCEPLWQGDLHYDRERALPLSLVARPDGPLKLWVNPDAEGSMPKGRYAAGADVSTGTGATPSCLTILNQFGEKVAEYTNAHLTGDVFGRLAIALCKLFKGSTGEGAIFAWEAFGPGMLVSKAAMDVGYGNVYYRTKEFDVNRERTGEPGWYPTTASKMVLLEEYRSALENFQFVNHSVAALQECLAFFYTPRGTVEHGNEATGADDPTAARANHGDRVIADALAWKMAVEFVRHKPDTSKEPEVFHPGSLAGRRALAERKTQGVWS